MRTLLNGTVAAIVAAGLSVAPALSGQPYTDLKYGYTVEFPDGWLVAAEKDAPGVVVGIGGRDTPDLRICLVTVTEDRSTATLSQGQLNDRMRTPMGAEFWMSSIGQILKNPKIVSSGVREHPSGLVAQEVLMSYQLSETDTKLMRMGMSIMMTPDRAYSVGCNAAAPTYAKFQTELAAVVNSFRHGVGLEARVNPALVGDAVVTVAAPPALPTQIGPVVVQTIQRLQSKSK